MSISMSEPHEVSGQTLLSVSVVLLFCGYQGNQRRKKGILMSLSGSCLDSSGMFLLFEEYMDLLHWDPVKYGWLCPDCEEGKAKTETEGMNAVLRPNPIQPQHQTDDTQGTLGPPGSGDNLRDGRKYSRGEGEWTQWTQFCWHRKEETHCGPCILTWREKTKVPFHWGSLSQPWQYCWMQQ